jgi:hypothetical protein
MARNSLFRHPRWFAIAIACVLLTMATQLVEPPPHAWSASPFHIELTLQDPSSGGPITQDDALTLTAKVFKNGVRTHGGEIVVSTNAPTKRYLCEIHTFPYSRDTCQTYLPKAGFWHIVARLTSASVPPWRYVASATISVNVFSDVNN